MEVKMSKCNNCGKLAEDYDNEVGWIRLDAVGSITISGGRSEDGASDPLRYIQGSFGVRDFCCINCLINFLYFKENYFNADDIKTLNQKLDSISSIERRQKIENMLSDIKEKLFVAKDNKFKGENENQQ